MDGIPKPKLETLHHFFGNAYQDWDEVPDRTMLKLYTALNLKEIQESGIQVEFFELKEGGQPKILIFE